MQRSRWYLAAVLVSALNVSLADGQAKTPEAVVTTQRPDGLNQTDTLGKANGAPAHKDQVKEQFVLRFVARELDAGKTVNSREYVVYTYADATSLGEAQIRAGGRVPVASQTGPSSALTTWQYIDVGINFDCRDIQLSGSNLNLRVFADVSAFTVGKDNVQPTIQQNKWQGSVSVPVGKTTMIFSSQDVVSTRSMQIDLTVTRPH